MEESKKTSALILNRQPYREYDSLVTVYTPDLGKLNLVARGTQKLQSKLAGHIEPLTLAEIMIITGRGFDYIGSAVSREVYAGIRQDLNKLYYAGQALKLFNRLVKEGEAEAGLFFLLADWLEVLNNFSDFNKEKGELFLGFFTWQFLAALGYKPEMYKCLVKGEEIRPGQSYFNLAKGGLVCQSCFEQERVAANLVSTELLPISDNCVKIIRFILTGKFSQAEKIKIDKKLIRELIILADGFVKFCF